MLLLSACSEPPLLGSLAEVLAAEAVADAEPGLQIHFAVASVLAESCAVDNVDSHDFNGPGAGALGIHGSPEVVRDDAAGKLYWTFQPAGLDEVEGKIVFETDSTRQNFAVVYQGGAYVLNADLSITYCDEAWHTPRADDARRAPDTGDFDTATTTTTTDTDTGEISTGKEAIISGTSTFTDQSSDITITITTLGDEPYAGLGWTPVTARLPVAGFLRSTTEDEETKITLQDASVLPAGATAWPGTATSNRWESDILVALP